MTDRTFTASLLVRRAFAALLVVLAIPLVGVGVSALSKLTRDHLDADRTQVTVIGVFLLAVAAAMLVAAAVLARSPHVPRPPR